MNIRKMIVNSVLPNSDDNDVQGFFDKWMCLNQVLRYDGDNEYNWRNIQFNAGKVSENPNESR